MILGVAVFSLLCAVMDKSLTRGGGGGGDSHMKKSGRCFLSR